MSLCSSLDVEMCIIDEIYAKYLFLNFFHGWVMINGKLLNFIFI